MEKILRVVAVLMAILFVISIPVAYIESNGNLQFTAMYSISYATIICMIVLFVFSWEKA